MGPGSDAESLDAARPTAPVPWRRVFRLLSLAYGWTPDEIGNLTLAQIKLYLADAPDTSRRQLPPDEARALSARVRQSKQDWIEQQLTQASLVAET